MTIASYDGIEPASDRLIETLTALDQERRAHDHPKQGTDVYCVNQTSFMGAHMGSVLVRLREAEAELQRLRDAVQRVHELHPKRENPTHGCCAPPKLCEGHAAECRVREHGLMWTTWPCPTIAALDA